MLVTWVIQVLDVTWTDGPSQAAPPSEPPPPPPPDDDSDSDASEQPQSLPVQEEVGKALCTHCINETTDLCDSLIHIISTPCWLPVATHVTCFLYLIKRRVFRFRDTSEICHIRLIFFFFFFFFFFFL